MKDCGASKTPAKCANGYVVGMTPKLENTKYSDHFNFTDLSTLQYLPAYKKLLAFLKWQHLKLVGNGDGEKIIRNINHYLLTFFDTYLKNNPDKDFDQCKNLTDDSYIQCNH